MSLIEIDYSNILNLGTEDVMSKNATPHIVIYYFSENNITLDMLSKITENIKVIVSNNIRNMPPIDNECYNKIEKEGLPFLLYGEPCNPYTKEYTDDLLRFAEEAENMSTNIVIIDDLPYHVGHFIYHLVDGFADQILTCISKETNGKRVIEEYGYFIT